MTSEIEINIGSQSSTTEKSDTDHEYAPAPIVDGARLGPNVINRLLVTSDSGYTYLANDGRTVVQEFFPQQFAVRDVDGIGIATDVHSEGLCVEGDCCEVPHLFGCT